MSYSTDYAFFNTLQNAFDPPPPYPPHLRMNMAPDHTIILGLQIFVDHRSLSSIDQKILILFSGCSHSITDMLYTFFRCVQMFKDVFRLLQMFLDFLWMFSGCFMLFSRCSQDVLRHSAY